MKNILFSLIVLMMIVPPAQADGPKLVGTAGAPAVEGCSLSQGDRRTPSVPSDLAAAYDHSSGEIYLVWSQPGDVPVCYWEVYYSLSSGGPYHKLGRADNNGESQQVFSAHLAAVPSGDAAMVYLVVVSFRSDEIFSAESREVNLLVDHRQELPDHRETPGTHTLPVKNWPVMAAAGSN